MSLARVTDAGNLLLVRIFPCRIEGKLGFLQHLHFAIILGADVFNTKGVLEH